MTSKHAWILLGSVGVAALTTAPEAIAQQVSQATAGSGLEEIVVTARRREELIQSVPVAITAFSAEDVREKRIESSLDLGKLVPSFQVKEVTRGFSNGPGSQQSFLRGLPGVRTYFAEVPYPITGPGTFYDLQNVQALVGPQGTLFGLNATGGAILLEPKKPTNQYEATVDALVGSYSWRRINGSVNIPIVDDKVLFRAAFWRELRDGFTEVVSTGERMDNMDNWAWRAALTVKPTDDIENYFLYMGLWNDTRQASAEMLDFNPRGTPTFIVGTAALQAALNRQRELGHRRLQAVNVDDNNQEERHFFVDIFQWRINDELLFKNIAGYRRIGGLSRYDSDGTALGLFGGSNQGIGLFKISYARNYTEEAQLQGTFLDGKLTTVAGGFVQYNDTTAPTQPLGRASYAVGLLQQNGSDRNDPKGRTQSLFGQGTLDLTALSPSLDGFRFTGGFRYNWDWQSTWAYGVGANGVTCSNALADRNCVQQLGGKFKAPSWTVTLDYQFDADKMVYVTNRRGYSTGVFNSTAPTAELQNTDPEYNTDVEIGLKADWQLGDVILRTNASAFYEWYDNVQRVASLVFINNAGNQQTIALNLNAAKARIKGIDLSALARLTKDFELSGTYTHIDAKYIAFKSVDSAGNPIDLSNQPFGVVPKNRFSVSARYYLPIDETLGRASVQATYTRQDGYFSEAGAGTPFAQRPGYGLLDLRADWNNIAGYPIDLGVFATNVTNTLWAAGDFPVWNSLGFHAQIWAEPRMWGVQLRYRFNQ
jgi:iron complex outermembrane recepter protein